ncbi:MAG: acyl carrier protein [Actinomycetota bacterium]|nr:acyl carrier protein [Actinomycetota bacterium]
MTTQNDPDIVTDTIDAELKEILISDVGLRPSSFDGTENLVLEELGLDSLAAMELQAIVKARHGVQIPEEALSMRVDEISTFLRSALREAN